MGEPSSDLARAIQSLDASIDLLRHDLAHSKEMYDEQRKADRAEVAAVRELAHDVKDTMSKFVWVMTSSLTLPLTAAVILFFTRG